MAGQENGFFFFCIKHALFSCCGFFLGVSPPKKKKFVTTMEIPFKSGLGRTGSSHHPPAQPRLPLPLLGQSHQPRCTHQGRSGMRCWGENRGAQKRVWGDRWQRGIEEKGPKEADAVGGSCGGKHRDPPGKRGRTVRPQLGGRGLGTVGHAEVKLISVHLGFFFSPPEDLKPLLNYNWSKRGIKGQG